MRSFAHFAVVLCLLSSAVNNSWGQNASADKKSEEVSNQDTALIQSAIQAYVTAFNAKDAEKLSALWTTGGVYVSRATGEQVVGREVMTKEFGALFKEDKAPQLAVTTESIEFISPNVALERGTATVTSTAGDVDETNYRVVFVKRDGAWLIDRVTEDAVAVENPQAQQLKKLEWLVGEWVYAGEDMTIEMSCQWTRNQNFISRRYQIINQDQVSSSGLQIIGWDEAKKVYRSWLFDSDGGFAAGTWTLSDDKWVNQSVVTLADGASGSFTSILQPTEDGNFLWQKKNRVLDGRLLPNLSEVVVQRK